MVTKERSYGVMSALLLIIVVALISYIAYNKGLEQSTDQEEVTKNVVKNNEKFSGYFTYDELCKAEETCNKEIANFGEAEDNIVIKIDARSDKSNNEHNIIIEGKIEKTISLGKFASINIIDSEFIIIRSEVLNRDEVSLLKLYDINFKKLDEIEINTYQEEKQEGLKLTYYTFDHECSKEKDNNFFIEHLASITKDGFNLLETKKGPEKTEGFTCGS